MVRWQFGSEYRVDIAPISFVRTDDNVFVKMPEQDSIHIREALPVPVCLEVFRRLWFSAYVWFIDIV